MDSERIYDLIVIGAGAAGIFGAIQTAERRPDFNIVVLEKSTKILAKVKVSGGGRCNVTHSCFNPFRLAEHYPRGVRPLKQLFKTFQASDMVSWLENKGVKLKAENDGRMFPITDSSQTVIDCFLEEVQKHRITIKTQTAVEEIASENDLIRISCSNQLEFRAKKVLVAIGGSPGSGAYGFLEKLGHNIIEPIPSLFTFNDPGKMFADLMGISVQNAEVRISATKFLQRGPVLITHWGLSGPAVIKLSAWAAEHLHAAKYQFAVTINWTELEQEESIRSVFAENRIKRPRQKIMSNTCFSIPTRLWEKLCLLSGINENVLWGELPNKNLNKLVENLFRCPFRISGKTTFKEEFVTCGGVDLKDVNPGTMESLKTPGLFFAGEVLNVDGETGGFNFQAAWTTGYIAATNISKPVDQNP